MSNILNSWQFYVILAIISDVVFTQNYKLAVRHAKNDSAATILMETISGVFSLLFIPLFPLLIPLSPILYAAILTSVVFGSIQDRLKTTARKMLPAGESAILNELTSAFLIILGFIVFRQPFIVTRIIGAILILGANGILAYKKGKFVFNKYTLLFAIACVCAATSIGLDIGVSQFFNLPLYIGFLYLACAIFIKLTTRTKWGEVKREFLPSQRKYYLITGMAWAIGFFAILRSAQTGPIAIVIPLITLSVLLNVIVAAFVHKEIGYIRRKIFIAIIVLVGVFLTVWH